VIAVKKGISGISFALKNEKDARDKKKLNQPQVFAKLIFF